MKNLMNCDETIIELLFFIIFTIIDKKFISYQKMMYEMKEIIENNNYYSFVFFLNIFFYFIFHKILIV